MSAGRRRRTPAWVSRAVAIGVLVVVLIVAAVLLLRSRAQTGTQYQTAQATKGTLTVAVNGSGTAVAGRTSSIDPSVSGTVKGLQVKLGDRVRRGDVLFTLVNPSLKTSRASALAQVRQAQQQVTSARLQYEQADQQLDQLQAPPSTTTTRAAPVTDDDIQIAELRIRAARKTESSARASLVSAKLAYRQATDNVDALVVRSNMTGYITTLNVTEGLSVGSGTSGTSSSNSSAGNSSSSSGSSSSGSSSGSGSSAPVVISDLNSMKASIALNQVDVSSVRVGQQVTVTFDSAPGLSITGEVASIAQEGATSQSVVTYDAEIDFDLQNKHIKPGMTCSAQIVTAIRRDVVLVANSAVKSDSNGSYVQALQTSTGTPVRQAVTVGASNDTLTEIKSGLREGQMVVTGTLGATTATTGSSAFGGGAGGGALRGLSGGGGGGFRGGQ